MIGWPAYRSEREREDLGCYWMWADDLGGEEGWPWRERMDQFWPKYEGTWVEMKKKKKVDLAHDIF
jgi:hypothetical protein